MIKELWNKLDAGQRKLIIGAAIFVCAALMLEWVILPFWESGKKMERAIASGQKKRLEIGDLAARYNSLKARSAALEAAAAARGADFSLFSYLEKKATQANVRGRIKNMNSSKGMQTAAFEESLVDMKLDKITIKQLTDFLYFAESPADSIRIKKMTVSKMKESPDYLSVQLQISSFQPVSRTKDRSS